MKYNEIVNIFKKSTYVTAITKNLPREVVETVFNRTLESGLNPIIPLTQIAVETSGIPKLHIKYNNSHNWFNITAKGSEKYATYPVPEYTRSGKKVMKNVNFKIFDSLNDAVDAFISLIKRSYPHYNELNNKSLINKNGAAYASAEYSGKTYTQYVVDEVHAHLNRLGIKDHSFKNLQILFNKNSYGDFKTMSDRNEKNALAKEIFTNNKTAILKRTPGTIKIKSLSNKDDKIKVNNSSSKDFGQTGKIEQKDSEISTMKKKEVKEKHNVSYSKGYQLEFIPNGVYITYEGKTTLMVNSTSVPFSNFVKLIIKGVKNEVNWENKNK